MDGICTRSEETCWFNHQLPLAGTKDYEEAVERKNQYLANKAVRKQQKNNQ